MGSEDGPHLALMRNCRRWGIRVGRRRSALAVTGAGRRRRRAGARDWNPVARGVQSSVGGDAAGLDAELARVAAGARHRGCASESGERMRGHGMAATTDGRRR